MSVINQMLKDLDERQAESETNTGSLPKNINIKKSNTPFLIAAVFILILINITGIFVWNLYNENQQLIKKNQTKVESPDLLIKSENIKEIVNSIDEQALQEVQYAKNSGIIRKSDGINEDTLPIQTKNIEKQSNHDSLPTEPQSSLLRPESINVLEAQKNSRIQKNDFNIVKSPSSNNTIITPIEESLEINEVTEVTAKPKKSTLSISRKKLSPERVVKQKLDAAERAIMDNDVPKAEKLLEEILLISPEHKSGRKQLAALWFGRKQLRAAINLLSRGIDIHPTEVDFRLMKARILLSQNNNKEAYTVLNSYALAKNIEYQTLLVNTAQLLEEKESVITAYKQLVSLEEYKGKWWLGLAIALDRNSQFSEAKSTYSKALLKHDLSNESAEFIRQRITELGE